MYYLFMQKNELTEIVEYCVSSKNLLDIAFSKIKDATCLEKFCILNSRVSPSIATGDAWILEINRILREVSRQEYCLISGVGMLHLNYPLYCWICLNGSVIVVYESSAQKKYIESSMEYQWLTKSRCLITSVFVQIPHPKRRYPGLLRDASVITVSDFMMTGKININGNMEQLHQLFLDRGRKTIPIPYQLKSGSPEIVSKPEKIQRQMYKKMKVNTGCSKNINLKSYFYHYTRSRNKPWPGEGWDSYFNDLSGHGVPVPYQASDALLRIITQKKMYASASLIQGGEAVICFTELEPPQMIRFFHWQAHLRRYRFEPYGLGIKKDVMMELGIEKVVYIDRKPKEKYGLKKSYLYQSKGHSRYTPSWAEEMEWRLSGHLDLTSIRNDDLLLVLPYHVPWHLELNHIKIPIFFI